MKMYFLALALVLFVVISGCASSPVAGGPNVKEFKVKVSHTGYTFYSNNRPLIKVSVAKGDTVRLLATIQVEEDDHGHGITIDEFGINRKVESANENLPTVVEFVANETGRFRVYCKTCLEGAFSERHPSIEEFIEVK